MTHSLHKCMLVFLAFFAVPGLGCASCEDFINSLLGPPPDCVMTGNGALTIGTDMSGHILFCRWPSPGYCNQVQRVACGLDVDGQVLCLGDAGWQVEQPPQSSPRGISMKGTFGSVGISCRQEMTVHPQHDLLAIQMVVCGATTPPTFLFAPKLMPHMRIVPGLPIDDLLGEQFNPSTTFSADNQTVYCHSSENGRGVWIAYQSLGTTDVYREDTGVMEAVPEAGRDGSFTATFVVAFGQTQADVDTILAAARGATYDSIAMESDIHWSNSLAPSIDSNLLTIAQCMDRRSGAIVRSPARSWLALDWIRQTAYTTLALDMAGHHELAESHTLFYAERVRRTTQPGRPFGSVPAAVYADGTDGLPQQILESDATAWLLASFWRHAQFLPNGERQAYLERVWESVPPSMEFLTSWTDGRNREPFFSFDPRVCKDTQSIHLLLTHYMGVDAALRIAATLDKAPPESWKRRKTELDILVRFHCVDEEGKWKVPDHLPFWAHEFGEARLPFWDAVIEQQTGEEAPSLEVLCGAAIVWQNVPEKLSGIRPKIDCALSKAMTYPDSYEAALRAVLKLSSTANER